MFRDPVVDGASGSGKSRLCWETGMHFVRQNGTQLAFMNRGSVAFDFSGEKDIEQYAVRAVPGRDSLQAFCTKGRAFERAAK